MFKKNYKKSWDNFYKKHRREIPKSYPFKEPTKTEKGTDLAWGLLCIVVVGYLLPVGFIIVKNFMHLVVFGDWTMSQYVENGMRMSFDNVNIFYVNLAQWLFDLISRLMS